MTGRTVEKGGQSFTVLDGGGRGRVRPGPIAEWPDSIRLHWEDERSFAVLNLNAPQGAIIEVLSANGKRAVPGYLRRPDGWVPLGGPLSAPCLSDAAIVALGTHWRPRGYGPWYPFALDGCKITDLIRLAGDPFDV